MERGEGAIPHQGPGDEKEDHFIFADRRVRIDTEGDLAGGRVGAVAGSADREGGKQDPGGECSCEWGQTARRCFISTRILAASMILGGLGGRVRCDWSRRSSLMWWILMWSSDGDLVEILEISKTADEDRNHP